jgi:hypothetical protein
LNVTVALQHAEYGGFTWRAAAAFSSLSFVADVAPIDLEVAG